MTADLQIPEQKERQDVETGPPDFSVRNESIARPKIRCRLVSMAMSPIDSSHAYIENKARGDQIHCVSCKKFTSKIEDYAVHSTEYRTMSPCVWCNGSLSVSA